MKSYSFVTKVYESEITFDHKKLMQVLKKEKIEKFPYLHTTFFREKNILIQEQFKFLLGSCRKFYNEIAKEKNYTSWKLQESWIQRYDKGEFHDTHLHISLEHHWNFVFYLDCKEDSSNMVILEPGYPYVNWRMQVVIKPKIGRCVAFPGHLPHFVEPNPSDKRIILSTNLEYFPKDEKCLKNV